MVGIYSYGELLQKAYANHKSKIKYNRDKGIISSRERFGLFSGHFSRSMRELVKKTLSTNTSIKQGFIDRVMGGVPHANKISYFTHLSFNEEINDEKREYLQYPTKDDIIGCVIYRNLSFDIEKREKRQAILLCFIHPQYRNMGYGELMMKTFIEKQTRKHKSLNIVLHSVEKAEEFYTRLGFHKIDHDEFIERFETIEEYDIIMEKRTKII